MANVDRWIGGCSCCTGPTSRRSRSKICLKGGRRLQHPKCYEESLLSRKLFALIASIGGLLVASPVEAGCSVSDIQIKQATLIHRGSKGQFPTIVGELYNGCSEATGVQLHTTLLDKAGQVISARTEWPASTRNIPPRSLYAFELLVDEDRPAATVQVEPVEVKVWKDH
jgi:hypothetical protein